MIDEILLLFPCFLSLIWAMLGMYFKPMTYRKKTFIGLMLACALFYLGAANAASDSASQPSHLYVELVGRLASLLLFPIMILYVRRLSFHKYFSVGLTLMFLPAVVISTLDIFLAILEGLDKTSRNSRLNEIGNFVDGPLFLSVMAVMTLAFVLFVFYCLKRRDFKIRHFLAFLNGDIIERRDLNMLVLCVTGLLIMFRIVYTDGNWLSYTVTILLCILTFLQGYLELIVRCAVVHRSMILNSVQPSTLSDVDLDLANDQGNANLTADLSGNSFQVENYDELTKSFINSMDRQRLFLKPGLTIDQVAKTLNTNRTYISRIVNLYFKMTFPDYLNRKRLEYAKMLLKSDPSSKMQDIAVSSGFISGVQFTRKFKELEGISVRDWLSGHDSRNTLA